MIQEPIRTFNDWLKILPEIRSNNIPEITHPLGKGWDQPATSEIEIGSEFATMSKKTFDALAEYSCSQPSGVYEGKMWKANYSRHRKRFPEDPDQPDIWYLRWFGFSEYPDKVSNNSRKIIIK